MVKGTQQDRVPGSGMSTDESRRPETPRELLEANAVRHQDRVGGAVSAR